MPSKGVVDRQRVARRLIAAARTHAHEVGVRLPSHLAEPPGDGGTPSATQVPELADRIRITPPTHRAARAASRKEG
jgi:hypothetical protein